MIRRASMTLAAAAGLVLLAAGAQPAAAQNARMGWMRFFLQPPVAIAQLEEVQKELKLTDEQIDAVETLNDEFNQDRMELFQSAGGDRETMRQELAKLNREMAEKFNKELEEPQQKRLHEIYLQVNGAVSLQDEKVAEALKITDEQKEKLDEARSASRQEFMSAGLRDLGEEEASKKVAELLKNRDEKLLAVLTDEQRSTLEKMKGEKLEVDLSKMPAPGR